MPNTYDKDEAQEALGEQYGDTLRGLYRHYKGGLYVAFSESVDEATGEALVHYYSIEKRTRWTRTVRNFTAKIDGDRTPRFAFIRGAHFDELRQAAFDNGEDV